ncbi:DUF5667 domain-containing protein [Effusibacillus dendaii]|uniref:DUF5667 domain-containing protein n=1 Tax=Effusibacillus dendaii TaxID=2743772 RepID=A0A7I8D8A1_9BACL|nr:DUF5667 domain-containing protein [Effusibacillus dendaii]BCJ86368.1 hypothetical protein skT53_13530 [Effusibacillus dendaii]
MNKKITSAFLASIVLSGTVPVIAVGAATATNQSVTITETTPATGNATTAGTTTTAVDPESFLYKLRELLAQLHLAFTFKDQQKADLLLKQADQKLAELQTLNQAGKVGYNEKFVHDIDDALSKAEEALEQAKQAAKANKDETVNVEVANKEQAAILAQKHSIAVLQMLLAKVPEEGKEEIQKALDKQVAELAKKGVVMELPVHTEGGNQAGNATVTISENGAGTTPNNTDLANNANTSSNIIIGANDANTSSNITGMNHHDNGLHLGQVKHRNNDDNEQHGKQHNKKEHEDD